METSSLFRSQLEYFQSFSTLSVSFHSPSSLSLYESLFLEHVEARFRQREHGILSRKDRNGGDLGTPFRRTLSANLGANRKPGRSWWKQCGKEVVQEKDEEDGLVGLEVAREVSAIPVEDAIELEAHNMMMDYEAEIIALKSERNREFKTQVRIIPRVLSSWRTHKSNWSDFFIAARIPFAMGVWHDRLR